MKTLPKVLIAIFCGAILLIVVAFVAIILSAEKEAVNQPQGESIEEVRQELSSEEEARRRMRMR